MTTITVSEFEREIGYIDMLQDRVAEILKSNWAYKWLHFDEAKNLHEISHNRMKELFAMQIIPDQDENE